VAGVQLAFRQQFSPAPAFQTVPSEARQLSAELDCANASIGAAKVAEANSAATLLSFFMILLSGVLADACEMFTSEARKPGKHPVYERSPPASKILP
jgi:hypothetical protein